MKIFHHFVLKQKLSMCRRILMRVWSYRLIHAVVWFSVLSCSVLTVFFSFFWGHNTSVPLSFYLPPRNSKASWLSLPSFILNCCFPSLSPLLLGSKSHVTFQSCCSYAMGCLHWNEKWQNKLIRFAWRGILQQSGFIVSLSILLLLIPLEHEVLRNLLLWKTINIYLAWRVPVVVVAVVAAGVGAVISKNPSCPLR